MAKAPRGRRRLDKFAMGRSLLVFLGLALLAAACMGQRGGAADTAGAWEWDDEGGREDNYNMQERQAAMEEAVRAFSGYSPDTTLQRTMKRAMATVNREIGHLRPITVAISNMPEKTAAQVRAKEEARAAFNERLSSHLGQLLPGGSVKIISEPGAGRTIAELSGGSAPDSVYKTKLLLNDV